MMRNKKKLSARSKMIKISAALALSAAFVSAPQTVSAQTIDLGAGGIGEAIGKAIQEAMSKMMNRKVTMTPAIVNVNTEEKTATLEFSNESQDTLVATVSAGVNAPLLMGATANAADQAGGLLADDEPAEKKDEIDAKFSLASWVKDLPEKITLAPGEKKSVTVKLEVPASAADGEYSAWILASTEPPAEGAATKTGEGGGVIIKMDGGSRPKMTSGTKLTYRVANKK